MSEKNGICITSTSIYNFHASALVFVLHIMSEFTIYNYSTDIDCDNLNSNNNWLARRMFLYLASSYERKNEVIDLFYILDFRQVFSVRRKKQFCNKQNYKYFESFMSVRRIVLYGVLCIKKPHSVRCEGLNVMTCTLCTCHMSRETWRDAQCYLHGRPIRNVDKFVA